MPRHDTFAPSGLANTCIANRGLAPTAIDFRPVGTEEEREEEKEVGGCSFDLTVLGADWSKNDSRPIFHSSLEEVLH